MEEQIQEFLEALKNSKGYARNTIEAYRNDLNQFLNFALNERSTLNSWGRVDKPLLLTFVMHLTEREYTPSSVARKVAVLKSFYHFLVEQKIVDDDPTATLGSPKVEKHLPQILTLAEIDQLMAAPTKNNTPKGFRDCAILQLLYASGLRVTELTSLNVGDVNLETSALHCTGRGGKRRVIPIDARAVSAVNQYLERGRPVFIVSDNQAALFVNPHGERLTRQGLWLIIKEYVKEANIATPVTPHTLRHSFAVHLLNGGANIQDVQHLLGHASKATTQMYTRLVQATVPDVPDESTDLMR